MRIHPLRRFAAGLLLASLAAGGCVHLGPKTVAHSRFSYNVAVARSGDEQLLLNLVRLRYRDNPLFLDITSVVTQFTFGAEATASATLATGDDEVELGADLTYSEVPTVSYAPLQGSDFATRFLSPVSPSILFLLSQSGWSVERLLLCCVQRVNELPNAVAAAGPTPDYIPRFEGFHRLAAVLRRLQIAGHLGLELREKDLYLRFTRPAEGSSEAADLEKVRDLLGLDRGLDAYRLREDTLAPRKQDEIDFTGRSLLAVMFFLSQAVEAPERDEREGRVTVTRAADGETFDWSRVTGRLIRIRSASQRPEEAAVKVLYRGSWFYLDDSDLNSKSTFNLLTYLLALKAGNSTGTAPLLTLGVD